MFRDTALLPAQAVRLTALGLLAEGPHRYAELARQVGDFTTHILGKSLDLMGNSLELLRYEGLIEAVAGTGTGMVDNAEMRLTAAGRDQMRALLRAALRGPSIDINRLVLALKLRFLPHLDRSERREQLMLMREWYAGEIARFEELRASHATRSPLFGRWLDSEIDLARSRLDDLGTEWQASEVAADPL